MSLLTVDLTNCEREPIHILGHIQSYGYLIAIQPDTYSIVHASDNIVDLVGLSAAQLLGQPLSALLTDTDLPVSTLVELVNVGLRNDSWETMNPYRLTINGRVWNLIIHQHQGLIILEWEPVGDDRNVLVNQQLIAQALTEVQSSRTLSELLQNTARRVKAIIGFDRVMVYRFSPDWHGHVVAEEKEEYLEPYLGLHYPASDIPRQARELYKVNLVRLIADATSVPSRILSQPDLSGNEPLDLTHSVLRAVSPVHIEYLYNMGVQASMSISLLYRGELWGLISCHNMTPRFVDYPARQAAKFVSQLLSTALEFRKDNEEEKDLLQYRQNGQSLHEQLLLSDDIVRALTKYSVTALDVNGATGAALLFNGRLYTLGETPDEAAVRTLIEWIGDTNTETFFETNQLPVLYPPAEEFRGVGAGLFAIVLSRELNEYLLWFKPEQVQQVTWAGNPDKPVTVDPNGQHRISPRTSFAAWTEIVHNTSEPWTETELSVVVKLREDIMQVLTRQANQIRHLNQRLQVAYDELDAFSYTVSHDLRTPLSSIRCYSEILLEEYGQDFNPDAQELFQKVIDSTERMQGLIRHILYYSRMGRTELTLRPIDMNELLERIREEIMITAKDRVLRIELGDVPPLTADPIMMLQLFTNLVSNAAKYTQLKAEAIVRINGQQTDDELIYTVEDNGIGFDMKHAGKMFDLFKRLENARSYEGSGVGLAIVKRVVNRHNGKIWFHSEPGRGTTFSVSFPLNPIA
ncbi:ATP-binding protein [Spirosoma endophyticum]|uniref:histidine kinase n=1 Tax=Spirosoma endophyticum TaxID=662367 RepID=A0A1I1XVC1_9BACT|nr:ATP-binding protein [Spirosoma endophyticum]SFE11211.1 Bacteriophytochrome (light-regulated signal transduction histidine kinase) [Spirosoma endophyticum]